jgi:ribosomal protein S18 acetylase RimI-like enzyme
VTAEAAVALDANFAELIRWYGGRPGGEVRDAPDVTLCSTGLDFRSVNGAVGLRLDPATIEDRIADVTRWFAERVGTWRWLVGPTSTPLDLDRHLRAAGFELVSDNPGMALDLGQSADVERPPGGVEIRPLDDLGGLDAWAEINRRALELDPLRARAWRDAQDRAIGSGVPMRIWIASLHGEPVAAAALFDGAEVAGVYNVATVPEARGRGIGRAVTATVLAEAVARGHRLAVLGSSDLGYPVYRRLGFREVSRLRSYALPVA